MSNKAEAKTMKQDAKRELKPKLRFPEFRDAEGWENKLLAPFIEECSARVPSDTSLPVYSSTREGLKRQDAYFDGRVLLNENEYGVVPPGCFVYRHMSDDGLFKFNINNTDGDIAVSKEYPVFKTKDLNSLFLLNKLNEGPDFKQFAFSQKAGGTRTRLYFSKLCGWRTLLPSVAEQQKIADCLTNFDELIAAHGQKLDALNAHKKGMMQQLFPLEGETLPRLRFLEFRDAPEWVEKEVSDLISTVTPPQKIQTSGYLTEGQFPIVDQSQSFICGWTNDATAVIENDLPLIVFGDHTCVLKFVNRPFAQGADGIKILKAKPCLFAEFLYNALQVRPLTSEEYKRHFSLLQEKKICFPEKETGEQQKIAGLLTSLDELIAAQTQKLEVFKTHKKGLMQQLFPSPEEVEA